MSDLRSRVLGTIFGTLSRGSFPKREPVAFLYNGVRLPGLPVVEGYAFLTLRLGIYTLYFSDFYEFGANSETGNWQVRIPEGNQMYQVTAENEWQKQVSTAARAINYENILWANFDVINPSGYVHMAASEPVPVYE